MLCHIHSVKLPKISVTIYQSNVAEMLNFTQVKKKKFIHIHVFHFKTWIHN